MFQPLFTSYFELASSVRFTHRFDFGVFLTFLGLKLSMEGIFWRFQDFLNIDMKLSQESFTPVHQAQVTFWLLLRKKNGVPKLSPG